MIEGSKSSKQELEQKPQRNALLAWVLVPFLYHPRPRGGIAQRGLGFPLQSWPQANVMRAFPQLGFHHPRGLSLVCVKLTKGTSRFLFPKDARKASWGLESTPSDTVSNPLLKEE